MNNITIRSFTTVIILPILIVLLIYITSNIPQVKLILLLLTIILIYNFNPANLSKIIGKNNYIKLGKSGKSGKSGKCSQSSKSNKYNKYLINNKIYLNLLKNNNTLDLLITKFNYWYQKTINIPTNCNISFYPQYLNNAKLYYNELVNTVASLRNSLTFQNKSERHDYLNIWKLTTIYMKADLDYLNALLINNEINPTIRNNALNGMASPNDTNDFLYNKNYSVL